MQNVTISPEEIEKAREELRKEFNAFVITLEEFNEGLEELNQMEGYLNANSNQNQN